MQIAIWHNVDMHQTRGQKGRKAIRKAEKPSPWNQSWIKSTIETYRNKSQVTKEKGDCLHMNDNQPPRTLSYQTTIFLFVICLFIFICL